MKDKNTIPTKLLWIDLEMTGLDPSKDRIVEVALDITDFDFKSLVTYEAVVNQPEEVINAMNPWAASQHSASGLTARIRDSKKTEQQVIHEVADIIREHFGDEPAILAGNSIHNDRIFIQRWWPDVEQLLHYRMLDVSSLKVLMQGKYGYVFEKESNHRAFDDIQASIAELYDYLEKLKS